MPKLTENEERLFYIIKNILDHYGAETETLIKKGTNVNIKDEDGNSPLHCAVNSGSYKIISILLKKRRDIKFCKAEVNAKNNLGFTPLDLAARSGKTLIFKLLLENFADPTIENVDTTKSPQITHTPISSLMTFLRGKSINYDTTDLYEIIWKLGIYSTKIFDPEIVIKQISELAKLINNKFVKNKIDKKPSDFLEELILHILSNDIEQVKILDKKYPELKFQINCCNKTPIMYATLIGLIEILKYFLNPQLALKNKTLVNTRIMDRETNYSSFTPLHIAAIRGLDDIVEILLAAGSEVNNTASDVGYTPAMLAAKNNHYKSLELIIKNGADLTITCLNSNTSKNMQSNGDTILHIAARKGHTKIMALLLSKNEQLLNQVNSFGYPPLFEACRLENPDALNLLLKHNADVTCLSEKPIISSALHIAAKSGGVEVIKVLLQKIDINTLNGYRETPLHVATFRNNVGAVQCLLEHGADHTLTDHKGNTPLHIAAFNNNVEVAEPLLKHGADCIAEDNEGNTPVHNAAFNNSAEVLKYLLDRGANHTLPDKQGNTPFCTAIKKGYIEIMKLLLSKNKKLLNQLNDNGFSPLFAACTLENTDALQLFLDHRVDIDPNNYHKGKNALHIATQSGGIKVIEVLIKVIDINNKTRNCQSTPLHLAALNNRVKVIQYLLDHGADYTLTNYKGETALDIAILHNHVESVECLQKHIAANSTSTDNKGKNPKMLLDKTKKIGETSTELKSSKFLDSKSENTLQQLEQPITSTPLSKSQRRRAQKKNKKERYFEYNYFGH